VSHINVFKASNGIEDTTYMQKYATSIQFPGGQATNNLRSIVALGNNATLAGSSAGLFYYKDGDITQLKLEWPDIKALHRDHKGKIWVGSIFGIMQFTHDGDGSNCTLKPFYILPPSTADGLIDFCVCYTDSEYPTVWLAMSKSGLAVLDTSDGRGADQTGLRSIKISDTGYQPPGDINAVFADRQGRVFVAGDKGVSMRLPNGHWRFFHPGNSGLPHRSTRCIHEDDQGNVWFGTRVGLARLGRDDLWLTIGRKEGLPVLDVHTVSSGSGILWIGTSAGAACLDLQSKLDPPRRWHYLSGGRYLPGDFVHDIAPVRDRMEAWIATSSGAAKIEYRPFRLSTKAKLFEERVRKRHIRLWGYVTSSALEVPGKLESSKPRPSDNDGLWTGLYVAAESYRYAVTGDDEARSYATQSLRAMLKLEEVTTVDGFPTKAIVPRGEPPQSGPVKWYPSKDGKWEWKGDCSSDEIVGHFYAYSVYYDLVATDEEKQELCCTVRRIMDHILDHGLKLIGPDNKRTRWGFWSPDILNSEGPEGWAEKGLNSLEILSHLKVAYHITGECGYEDAYTDLVENHHYAENTIEQKITLPGHVNHSDDELALLSYYPLLKYENDAKLRDIYLESLRRSWEIERPEANPLWNFIYGVLTGEDCDIEAAVRTLRQVPMDLITWTARNSHRSDITISDRPSRFGELQSEMVLPYDEQPIGKWNSNPYRLDGGNGGRNEDDGTFFLLPYWMGRYYGFIT